MATARRVATSNQTENRSQWEAGSVVPGGKVIIFYGNARSRAMELIERKRKSNAGTESIPHDRIIIELREAAGPV
jgi:hypothetical protein